jgi:hypothetical protein
MLQRRRFWMIALLVSCLSAAYPGRSEAQLDPSVTKGIQFLRTRANRGQQVGELAMIALAMLKADVPHSDPALAFCIERIRARFDGSVYDAQRKGGHDIYEASVVTMVLASLDPVVYRYEIETSANYIIGKQNANGSWDYENRPGRGDCSISQYAILGLWEAENAGAKVPASVWDRAAGFYLSVQSPNGTWNYHRDEPAMYPDSMSMTAAGIGSLLICDRQLQRYRHARDAVNPLLTPVATEVQEEQKRYEPGNSKATIDKAVNLGISTLSRMFRLTEPSLVGRSPYYGLYGMERVGALTEKDTLAGLDWYEQGRRYLVSTQQADGSWKAEYGYEANTVWSILFQVKATKRTIQKIKIQRLGGGNLVGGRGLPKDLSSVTLAGGHMVVRPMNGAIEGMLKVLEDPRAETGDSALAGLVERYQAGGPSTLRPFKDRFRKMLGDPNDSGVRRVACWGLGRIGDLDVVPMLSAALTRPGEDDAVVAEARTSLQFLSRKIDGFGPSIPSTPESRTEAAQKWLAWYNATRPIDQSTPDDTGLLAPAAAPAPARSEQQ